ERAPSFPSLSRHGSFPGRLSLSARRSLAEAPIARGSFGCLLLLFGLILAAFGVASPFLPALLHERGLGPSEIGAVLAAGTAARPTHRRPIVGPPRVCWRA